jgi:hypothetical protein
MTQLDRRLTAQEMGWPSGVEFRHKVEGECLSCRTKCSELWSTNAFITGEYLVLSLTPDGFMCVSSDRHIDDIEEVLNKVGRGYGQKVGSIPCVDGMSHDFYTIVKKEEHETVSD